MTIVVVDMILCDKTHKITVKLKEDGDLSLHIATDCDNIKEYARRLGDTLTVTDVTNWKKGKVYDQDICSVVSISCLAPAGIINAAWVELGMISKTKAEEVKANCVRFVKKGETGLIGSKSANGNSN